MASNIAVGGVLTECNHLGGLPIDLSVYESSELYRGDQVLTLSTSVVGGMLSDLRVQRAAPRPLLFAAACSGGPITADCYSQLRTELLERLAQSLPIDGLLMPLHGAALAEGEDDPEGDMIRAARDIVGAAVPIVVTLDLHANITPTMVSCADALLAWETYPHRDQFDTGRRAARLLSQMLTGAARPTMAMAKVPVITSAIHGSTDGNDPFADLMRKTKALEQQDNVLSTSLFLIHPYMDVAGMGSGGLVITDNDLDRARSLASELALDYWARRHDLEPATWTPAEAIAHGGAVAGAPVLLVETADCCGGGAAGDSIATLAALLDAPEKPAAFAPVVDPSAAAICHAAGSGSQVTLELGHHLDPRWGKPRTVTGTVEKLSDGRFTYTGGQWEGHHEQMGPTAVLAIDRIKVLIMSRATYDWADEQWRALDLNPLDAKFFVVKNPMNYRLTFAPLAAGCYILDTPGPTPASLKHVRFQKLTRPYFPADAEIEALAPTVLT